MHWRDHEQPGEQTTSAPQPIGNRTVHVQDSAPSSVWPMGQGVATRATSTYVLPLAPLAPDEEAVAEHHSRRVAVGDILAPPRGSVVRLGLETAVTPATLRPRASRHCISLHFTADRGAPRRGRRGGRGEARGERPRWEGDAEGGHPLVGRATRRRACGKALSRRDRRGPPDHRHVLTASAPAVVPCSGSPIKSSTAAPRRRPARRSARASLTRPSA